VGEEVRHVTCGQTAACFVPGEWTIQEAERHTPEANEGLLPRCRYHIWRGILCSQVLTFTAGFYCEHSGGGGEREIVRDSKNTYYLSGIGIWNLLITDLPL